MHELYREVGWKEGGGDLSVLACGLVSVSVCGAGAAYGEGRGGRRGSIV